MDKRKTKRELCRSTANSQPNKFHLKWEIVKSSSSVPEHRSFARFQTLRRSSEYSSVVVFVLISNMQRPQLRWAKIPNFVIRLIGRTCNQQCHFACVCAYCVELIQLKMIFKSHNLLMSSTTGEIDGGQQQPQLDHRSIDSMFIVRFRCRSIMATAPYSTRTKPRSFTILG